MPGLGPGIHACAALGRGKTWMAGTSPAMTTVYIQPNTWHVMPGLGPGIHASAACGRQGAAGAEAIRPAPQITTTFVPTLTRL